VLLQVASGVPATVTAETSWQLERNLVAETQATEV